MDLTFSSADGERGFRPGLSPHPFWKIAGSHQPEEPDQCGFAFPENDRTSSDHSQPSRRRAREDPLGLIGRIWKDESHETAGGEMTGSGRTVVLNVPTQLEATGDFLGMLAGESGAWRKIGWASQYQIKAFLRSKYGRIPQIAFPNVVASFQTVVASGAPS